jgi:hypothetical protein
MHDELVALLDALQGHQLEDPEYNQLVSAAERIEKLRQPLLRKRIDPNVVITSAVSVGTVVGLVFAENIGKFVSTKALGFVIRSRN